MFSNATYPIIPTDVNTFPWLSKIAGLFDQWEPHGIVFEFHTTSSTFNGTSQALGAVIMATEYDVNDPVYPSKQVMENADYACSSVPSANLLHGVECDPKERPLPVMYTTPRSGQLNFSTLGNFQIASQGCSTAGTTLGELWVSYDITFYKKQLVSSAFDVPNISGYGTATVGTPILNFSTIASQRNLTAQVIIGTGTDIFFPPSQGSGKYQLTLAHLGVYNASTVLAPTPTNCTITQSTQTTTTGGGSTYTAIIQISAAGAKLRFGLQTSASSQNDVGVLEVPPDYNPIA
jgi:hypothetical protein